MSMSSIEADQMQSWSDIVAQTKIRSEINYKMTYVVVLTRCRRLGGLGWRRSWGCRAGRWRSRDSHATVIRGRVDVVCTAELQRIIHLSPLVLKAIIWAVAIIILEFPSIINFHRQ